MAELPVLTPGNRNVLPNPNTGLFPSNLNLGSTPLFGSYGSTAPKAPASLLGSPGTYNAAVETNAGDYDRIMSDYDRLLQSGNPVNKAQYTPITPQLAEFQGATFSPSNGTSANSLREAAKTGGFSGDELSSIRARAVSPIRSIYANAQRNLDRSRSLQGGYSPNYAASSAKMARELSEQIGQANTNVEASIGEAVSRNRMSALSSLAPLEAEESRMRNQIAIANAEGLNRTNASNSEIVNRTNEQNRLLPLQYTQVNNAADATHFNNQLSAIEGKRSLYGTTPALVNTFGNQVLNSQQIANQQLSQQQEAIRQKQQIAANLALQLSQSGGKS